MKNKLPLLALATLLGLLSGCGKDAHQSLTARTKEVFDMGSVQLPRSDLFLHGYRVINSGEHDHFVYFVERQGLPVQGAGANYDVSSGKSTRNEAITSVVPPSVAALPELPGPASVTGQPATQVQVKDGNRVEIQCGQPAKCTTLADELAKLALKGLL